MVLGSAYLHDIAPKLADNPSHVSVQSRREYLFNPRARPRVE